MTGTLTPDSLERHQSAPPDQPSASEDTPRWRFGGGLLSTRYGGIWILAALVVLFAVTESETFLSATTLRATLGDQAITGLLALGVLLPLVAGHVDLSFASVAGLAVILSSWLGEHTALPTLLIVASVAAASALVGLVNGLFVSRLAVNSLFITLGVGTVVTGLTELVADHNAIRADFGEPYVTIARGQVADKIPYLFLLVLGFGALLHYLLEHTPVGRRLQACGGNPTAARLAGIRTRRIELSVFLVSAVTAGLTGFLLATKVGLGTETTTNGLLLPASSVLFLGATQYRERPNVPGTLLAMLIMGTGIKGFQLMGASAWVTNFFSGMVLLLAVVVSRGRVGRVR